MRHRVFSGIIHGHIMGIVWFQWFEWSSKPRKIEDLMGIQWV